MNLQKEYNKKNKYKIENIIVFILMTTILILSFTILYNKYIENKIDCLYASISYQTFTGTNIIEKDIENTNNLKVISIIQQIISFVITLFFSFYIFVN
jgi:hypothetical protein